MAVLKPQYQKEGYCISFIEYWLENQLDGVPKKVPQNANTDANVSRV